MKYYKYIGNKSINDITVSEGERIYDPSNPATIVICIEVEDNIYKRSTEWKQINDFNYLNRMIASAESNKDFVIQSRGKSMRYSPHKKLNVFSNR